MEKRKITDLKYPALFVLLTLFIGFSTGCSMLEMVGIQEENPNVTLEEDPGLKHHSIYRPANLDGLSEKLPIVAWGAGGCITYGEVYYEFLSHIAESGYLIIASNGIYELRQTNPDMIIEAIDWAISENSNPDSKYYNKLDTENIAVMGQSCGGLEALHAGGDPRVTTVVAWNSGIFATGNMGGATKEDLLALHTPTLYVNGGPNDIAYAQAATDWDDMPDTIPLVWANYDLSDNGTGVLGAHLGTFFEVRGGEFGKAGVLWLDFMLKGVEENKKAFVGPECGLCASDPKWSVQYKNWD